MFYLILTSLIWSLSFGLIKSQLTGFDAYLIAGLRLAISFLIFWPFMGKVPSGTALRLAGIGAIQFGLMYCFYIASYAWLSAAQVALLTITTPLFVVAWDQLLHRRYHAGFWVASALAVLAAAVLLWEETQWQGALKGVLLIQGANALFALGQILYKKYAPSGSAKRHFGYLYLGSLAVPLAFLLGRQTMPAIPTNLNTWLALIYLGVVASGIGFFLWNQGVRKVSNGVVAVMNNLKIPLGAMIAWWLFGESLHLGRWVVSAVIFAMGLGWLQKNARSHR